MNNPLVSVIVTTRNNETTIAACLGSIVRQRYAPIEIIVVDNASSDGTADIARSYTPLVFDKGPERSAQRNFAVSKASGQYVLIIDSDMELCVDVVASCVQTVKADNNIRAMVIPEESFGEGFWSQCKRLERSFYEGVAAIEAARFFDKSLYQEVGGYDETLTGAEDWDLTDRVAAKTDIGRAKEYILHNEGRINLRSALKKRFYYNKGFLQFYAKSAARHTKVGVGGNVLHYYKLYLSNPRKLFKNPLHGAGMLFMKTCEFGTGALSIIAAKLTKDSAV